MEIRTNINSDQFYCEDGNATDLFYSSDEKIKDHFLVRMTGSDK
jgi:hypothetical protein